MNYRAKFDGKLDIKAFKYLQPIIKINTCDNSNNEYHHFGLSKFYDFKLGFAVSHTSGKTFIELLEALQEHISYDRVDVSKMGSTGDKELQEIDRDSYQSVVVKQVSLIITEAPFIWDDTKIGALAYVSATAKTMMLSSKQYSHGGSQGGSTGILSNRSGVNKEKS